MLLEIAQAQQRRPRAVSVSKLKKKKRLRSSNAGGIGLTPVWELRCHTPPSKATVKRTSDLIQLKTPGLSAQLLCSQRAGLGSALSRWHSWIWVRYVASLLCPGLRAQTPGSGAFQASSGITGADPLWRKGQVAQQAIRDQRSRPHSGRPHQALPEFLTCTTWKLFQKGC